MRIIIPKYENPEVDRDFVENKIMKPLVEWGIKENIALEYSIEDGIEKITVYLYARLIEPVYPTYTYTASENYFIDVDEDGVPIAVNKYHPYISYRLKRARFLQWCHWAKLDNKINELLDKYGISAKVVSAWGVIRDGMTWEWIDPNNPEHEGWLHKFHDPEYVKKLLKERRKRSRK